VSDIDFDELDRAVNSLITSQPATGGSGVPGEPKEKVLNIKSAQPSTPSSTGITVPPVRSVPTPPTSPVLERRGGGQFMDVVHPSSNMRPTNLVMPDRPSRQQNTPTIQNNSPLMAPDVNRVAAQPVQPITPPAPSMPMGMAVDTPPAPAENVQDSPFLTDAKVEKRPLGAFSTEESTVPVPTAIISEPTPAASATVNPTILPTRDEEKPDNTVKSAINEGVTKSPVNVESPLPAELQNDLLLIESGSATNVDETMSDDNLATAATVAATSSINQQYTEKPNTGDQKSGAIYDTKSYHKSVTKPAGKKPGWMVVVWIILLLVVGAGAGAAVYWFVLK
jgi:hypothetical protein